MQAAYLSNHNIQIFTGLDVMNKPKARSILFANLIKAQSELNIELIYQILEKLHLAPANIRTLLRILNITITQQELYNTYGTHKLYYELVKKSKNPVNLAADKQRYNDQAIQINEFFNLIISFIKRNPFVFDNNFDSKKNELLTFLSDGDKILFNEQLVYYLKIIFFEKIKPRHTNSFCQ